MAGNVKSGTSKRHGKQHFSYLIQWPSGHRTLNWCWAHYCTGCSKWMPLKKELWHQFTYLSCLQSACFWVLGSYNLPCTIHSFSCGKNLKLRLLELSWFECLDTLKSTDGNNTFAESAAKLSQTLDMALCAGSAKYFENIWVKSIMIHDTFRY